MRKDTGPSWQDKTALITGSSSGIGAAIARLLAHQGMKVVLVARRLERLTRLSEEIRESGGRAEVIPADLSLEADRLRIFQQVTANVGSLDLLINNAGLGWYGYYADMPWEVAAQLLQVNITAVAHLSSMFLPQMRDRNRGHIINIGSVAGGFPNQGVALYSASKSFLDAFTTVLHRELRGTRVHCSVVRAGPVSTEFFDQAAKQPSGLPVPAQKFGVTPELVARRTWGLIKHPRRVIYVPRLLGIAPWIELLFGGIVDRLGPLLLRRSLAKIR